MAAPTVWLGTSTLTYPEGGGHFWAYLNWALGLRSAGCDVVWLDCYEPEFPRERLEGCYEVLKARLDHYGLGDSIAICRMDGLEVPPFPGLVDLASVDEADLILNICYYAYEPLLARVPRTAMIDIDPGLLQMWVDTGGVVLPRYDAYFTIGELSGNGRRIHDVGIPWVYTPPPVSLDWWPVSTAPEDAPFTTVSGWSSNDWFYVDDEWQPDQKRDGFEKILDLPRYTEVPLELALCLGKDEGADRADLEARGWRIVHAYSVSSTPWDYQAYIQRSRGEFSSSKPSTVYFQAGWISDRTLCYLASGKPAVVEHTGPSSLLPGDAGVHRFCDVREAARLLDRVASRYEEESRAARALAEELFDARKVVQRVLDAALA